MLEANEAKNNLSVALLQMDRPQDALEAVLDSDQIFAEAGDLKRQAMALGNQAAAWQELGQGDKALPLFEEAGRIFGEIGEGDLQAAVLKSAAAIQLKSGQLNNTAFAMLESLNAAQKPNLLQRFLKFLLRFFF
jgi:tetratricopeptide (TPR) repeat protein